MTVSEFLGELHGVQQDGGAKWTALCPAHDDHAPSLSVSEGDGGRVLVKCFAGCELEAILSSLGLKVRDLYPGASPVVEARRIVAEYTYEDETGERLFQVVRYAPKVFRRRKPVGVAADGSTEWQWNTRDVRSVLYRLPQVRVALNARRVVFVVEGEKDVEAVEAAGAVATCNPGGAGKWRSEYSESLQGAEVRIVADRDEPGRRHAWRVASELKGIAASVQVLEPAEGKDVADHLSADLSLDELVPAERPPEDQVDSAEVNAPPQGQRASTQRARVLTLIEDLELFRDERDRPYARVAIADHFETWPLTGGRFKPWLARLFHERSGEVPSNTALTEALNVLRGRALFDGEERELGNRFAWHDDALWYDLADAAWRAIRIDTEGWGVVDNPPPLFRRYPHQKPQVEAEPGGQLCELLDPFLNTASENDKTLLIIWLVAALLPDVPRAVLVPWGPQGCGKTSLSRMLRNLIDPSAVAMARFPRDDAEMAQTLDHHAASFFDNLSFVGQRESDTLCRAVTGDGFSKRKLYSDDDDVIYQFRRVILLNGINVPARSPDLLDRTILIRLKPIPETERLEERVIKAAFEQARPRIVGAMFDALSHAMAHRSEVEFDTLPRMADWARWGAAIADAVGIGAEEFLGAYTANRAVQNREALDSHPVGAAVIALMADRATWTGTPRELLKKLTRIAEDERINTRSKLWPESPNWLTRRLREVETNLENAGIRFERQHGDVRQLRLENTRKAVMEAVNPGTELRAIGPLSELGGRPDRVQGLAS
jgi:5S rRNA maturation endonuclease (ribonuclease M5)